MQGADGHICSTGIATVSTHCFQLTHKHLAYGHSITLAWTQLIIQKWVMFQHDLHNKFTPHYITVFSHTTVNIVHSFDTWIIPPQITTCCSSCFLLIQQRHTFSSYQNCHCTYSYGTSAHLVFFLCHHLSNKMVDMDHKFQNLYKLRAAARRRRTNLHFMPHNFTRSRANTTYFNWKEQLIYWRVEWIFSQADNIKCAGRRYVT
jgi:hypothetical protein